MISLLAEADRLEAGGFNLVIDIKVLNARLTAPFTLEIDFSDHTQGVFDANAYLSSRAGPLLDKLRDATYFQRFFH